SARPWVQWGKPDWLTYDTAAEAEGKTEDKTIMVTAKQVSSGSTGSAVKAMQILLNGLGFNCGTADGVFGTKTLAALKKYQTAKSLTADGICGAKTWAALIG
ncbi:MAG: peptidoglycan-binding protein, partial [Faecousia sp.]